MTSQGETTALNEGGDLETSVRSRSHTKAFYKRTLLTPVGKCVFCGGIVSCVLLLVYLLAKVVFGVLHIHACPVDPMIPLYLVVSPSLLILCVLVIVAVAFKCRRDEHDERVSPHHLIALVYFFLHLVLQLAGSVCVIRTRNDVAELKDSQLEISTGGASNSTSPEGSPRDLLCDNCLLSFAFGVVVFELILSGVVLVAVFLVLGEVIYLVCCQPDDPSKQTLPQTQANGI